MLRAKYLFIRVGEQNRKWNLPWGPKGSCKKVTTCLQMGMKLCRMTVLHNVQLGCGVLTFVEKDFLKSSVTKVKGDFDIFIKNKENKTTAKGQLIS